MMGLLPPWLARVIWLAIGLAVTAMLLVFWWQGELTSVLTERLTHVIERLVIDSSSWSDPKASYARLNEVVEAGNLKLVVHDLAWSRSWQFRLAVAALFDEPVALAALPAIRSVRLVHHPRHRASALMLLAWLSIQSGCFGTSARSHL